MYKLFIAFRYLRAHKVIYFSMVGVAVGILALVVVTSLMGGFSKDMRSRIRGMQTHISVVSNDKNLFFKDYLGLCDAIRKLPHVTGCAPRLEYQAWLGRKGSFSDVHLVGILPQYEKTVSELEAFFHKGGKEKFNFERDDGSPTRLPGVVVGTQLQLRGGIDSVGLLTARQSTTPLLCAKDFEIVGRFSSGMVEYDSSYLFMDLASAQELLQLETPPMANVLAVSLDDYEAYGKETRQKIIETLHAIRPCNNPETHRPGYYGSQCGIFLTQTWEQSRKVLLQAVEVEKAMMYIILFLVILVAGVMILAIYTLVVRAKTRDIGILRALGATEHGVLSVFIISGGLCGLFGSIFGVGLGLLLALNLNEVADFIRVVSRELNRIGLEGNGPRGPTILAFVGLLTAFVLLVANWLVLYKERRPHPWTRMIAAALALGAAAWLSTQWLVDYRPRDQYDADLSPSGRLWFTLIVVGSWGLFCAAWRYLDRYRRRPSWTYFGFAATIYMSAMVLMVVATGAIALGILIMQPSFMWPGLELFPRNIYYLDKIPVYVDYGAIGWIVVWTLVISFIWSIYPALKAASADPVEALRDE
jgi:lipoprotein-releasing system permease protein